MPAATWKVFNAGAHFVDDESGKTLCGVDVDVARSGKAEAACSTFLKTCVKCLRNYEHTRFAHLEPAVVKVSSRVTARAAAAVAAAAAARASK